MADPTPTPTPTSTTTSPSPTPTVTVTTTTTAKPVPAPTVTVTSTAPAPEPVPEPTVTQTVTASPAPTAVPVPAGEASTSVGLLIALGVLAAVLAVTTIVGFMAAASARKRRQRLADTTAHANAQYVLDTAALRATFAAQQLPAATVPEMWAPLRVTAVELGARWADTELVAGSQGQTDPYKALAQSTAAHATAMQQWVDAVTAGSTANVEAATEAVTTQERLLVTNLSSVFPNIVQPTTTSPTPQ